MSAWTRVRSLVVMVRVTRLDICEGRERCHEGLLLLDGVGGRGGCLFVALGASTRVRRPDSSWASKSSRRFEPRVVDPSRRWRRLRLGRAPRLDACWHREGADGAGEAALEVDVDGAVVCWKRSEDRTKNLTTGVTLPAAKDVVKSPWPAATAGGESPALTVKFLAPDAVCVTRGRILPSGRVGVRTWLLVASAVVSVGFASAVLTLIALMVMAVRAMVVSLAVGGVGSWVRPGRAADEAARLGGWGWLCDRRGERGDRRGRTSLAP